MKYLRKIAVSGLIAILAFFAGNLCLHPISAQAMEVSPALAMDGHEMDGNEPARDASSADSRNDAGGDVVQENDAPINAWNLCALNCASKTPQAVAAKKFSVDFSTDFPAGIPDDEILRFSESSSDPGDFSGVSPSPPDILSSVFKKE